jgi:hypothetical protein
VVIKWLLEESKWNAMDEEIKQAFNDKNKISLT